MEIWVTPEIEELSVRCTESANHGDFVDKHGVDHPSLPGYYKNS